jgi:2-keto-3-deoxy-L-rhamnonate aldolase RhmA
VTASPSSEVAFLANAGFDFLLFDTQHSAVEVKQLIPSIQAMRGKQAAPIIRVSDNRADLICFALDAGARGIIVPMVNTAEEAAAMVRACKYSPVGDRSNSGVRGEWGEHANYRDYLDAVNEGLLVIPMIETNRAIANIDAILSVPGIDVLLVGPSDLSIELGVPLEYPSDTYQRGLDRIAAACKEHGVVPGMYFIPPGMDPNFYVDKGFKFFTLPWDSWATSGVQNGLAAIKR